ncbi:MAG: hypothetical protein ACLQVL_04850 [Terriglobia bacterium]
MKITGLLMMPAGWIIVLAALVLLPVSLVMNLFIAAGIGVEILGLVLFTRSHMISRKGA